MGLALYFFIFSVLSFVSGLRNVTLDDNDASIIYSPGWNVSSGNDSFDFGGSLHFSHNATASASLTFQGVAVYLMAPFWSSSVGAQVALDDQDPFIIDLEDIGAAVEPGLGRETVQSLVVWAATELPNTQHTIVISMPARSQHVVLDGLIYSVVDGDNAASVPPPAASTSSSLTTSTTIEAFSSSRSFSSPRPSSSFFITSSSPSPTCTSKLSSTAPSRSPATPIENVAATSSSANTPVTTIRQSSPPDNLSASSNTSLKHTIAIGSAVAVVLVIAVLVALLCCLRRRRIRRRRELAFDWSQKFSPYPAPQKTHATRLTERPLSPQPQQPRPPRPRSPVPNGSPGSPVSSPLAPPAPTARRSPRSPLATAPPIMPPSPSPQSTHFPSNSPFLLAPVSPIPATPDLLTPPPPVTPGTPWSPQKSHRLSNASSVSSYESLSVESGAGYGWTTPSLVGIHPFSAGTGGAPVSAPRAEASTAGPSSSRTAAADPTYPPAPAARRPPIAVDTAPLTPRLSEKSAAALFAQPPPPLSPPAPAYKEKDAQRLFAIGRSRAGSQSSEAAPPLYEP